MFLPPGKVYNNCFMVIKGRNQKVLIKMGHFMQGAGFYYLGKNKKSICNNWTPANKKVLNQFSNNLATISSMSIHLDKSRSNSKDALVVRIIFGDDNIPMYFNEKYIDILEDVLGENGNNLVTNTANDGNFDVLGGIYVVDDDIKVRVCFFAFVFERI